MILADHRPARLYVLDFGLFNVGNGARIIGIQGYLVETNRGARILIDTGFPPEYATNYASAAARDGLDSFGTLIDFSPRQTAAGQLTVLGLTPADITHVVLSHGHIDHVGSLPLFAHAPVLMTRAERQTAKPLYFGGESPVDWPDADYHLIDDVTDICPGLTVIPTPGHTAGHASVMVSLPDTGTVILAGDALNRASEPQEGFPGVWDSAVARQSADQLFTLQAGHKAMMIYGHDPVQWPELRKAPAFYG